MFSWLASIIGIFLGNSLWLAGLIVVGIGIGVYRARPQSIEKAVRLMAMMSGGEPKGPALRLKSLIDPVDRRREVGRKLLIGGVIFIIIGCSFIARCA
ncbi:MAG: hypothetical protein R6V10_12595 [bacterium]